jgi:hypothetical protein
VPNAVAAYAGTPVECCGCEKLLYKLRRDIHHYDHVKAEDFEPVEGPPLINGQPGICPFCKHDYLGCFISAWLMVTSSPGRLLGGCSIKAKRLTS